MSAAGRPVQAADAAFRVPRVTWHLGRWIRTTDWYPDYQVRFYNRHLAEWTGNYVHEGISARGPILHRFSEEMCSPVHDRAVVLVVQLAVLPVVADLVSHRLLV